MDFNDPNCLDFIEDQSQLLMFLENVIRFDHQAFQIYTMPTFVKYLINKDLSTLNEENAIYNIANIPNQKHTRFILSVM